MADAGRPPTITDDRILKRLLEAFEWGMNQKDAARYAGIAPQTLSAALRRGREADEEMAEGGARAGKKPLTKDWPYVSFYRRVGEARSVMAAQAGKAAVKLLKGGRKVTEVTTEIYSIMEAGEGKEPVFVKVKETRERRVEELPPDSAMTRFVLQHNWGKSDGASTAESEGEGDTISPEQAETAMQKRAVQAFDALHLFDGLVEGQGEDDTYE